MSELAGESFDGLLREKIAELDAAEAPPAFLEDHPVDRLGLDARSCLQAARNRPRQMPGPRAYVGATQPPPSDSRVRHLDLVR